AIVLGLRRQPLEPAHRVVGEEAHRAAAEARQPRQRDRLVLAQQVGELLERVLRSLPHLLAFADLALVAACDEDQRRPAAEQREAAPLLAAFDALEQEGIGAVVHLAERGDRRVLVGEQLAVDRHQLAALRERAELGERGDDHRGLRAGAWASSSRACRRVVSVARSPASIRASSATRSSRSSAAMRATVRPPMVRFTTARWWAASAAIIGRWVTHRIWRWLASFRSRSPTAWAAAPPIPEPPPSNRQRPNRV